MRAGPRKPSHARSADQENRRCDAPDGQGRRRQTESRRNRDGHRGLGNEGGDGKAIDRVRSRRRQEVEPNRGCRNDQGASEPLEDLESLNLTRIIWAADACLQIPAGMEVGETLSSRNWLDVQ